MKALILAAGYAVRMYPLTKHYPKPLLSVRERPIIDYIVDKLQVIDEIDEIIVVTNSKFIPVFKKWAGNLKTAKRVSLVDDLTSSPDDRRGAIGDMDFSVETKSIKDDLLVIGGDNLFDDGLGDFLSFAKKNNPHTVIGAFDIKDLSSANKYGVVSLDKENKIIDFEEKPENPKSTLVAMCLYFFPKTKIGLIREYLKTKTHKNDATGFYIDWLRQKDAVYGFIFNGQWYDIGDKNFYSKAKETFLT